MCVCVCVCYELADQIVDVVNRITIKINGTLLSYLTFVVFDTCQTKQINVIMCVCDGVDGR